MYQGPSHEYGIQIVRHSVTGLGRVAVFDPQLLLIQLQHSCDLLQRYANLTLIHPRWCLFVYVYCLSPPAGGFATLPPMSTKSSPSAVSMERVFNCLLTPITENYRYIHEQNLTSRPDQAVNITFQPYHVSLKACTSICKTKMISLIVTLGWTGDMNSTCTQYEDYMNLMPIN